MRDTTSWRNSRWPAASARRSRLMSAGRRRRSRRSGPRRGLHRSPLGTRCREHTVRRAPRVGANSHVWVSSPREAGDGGPDRPGRSGRGIRARGAARGAAGDRSALAPRRGRRDHRGKGTPRKGGDDARDDEGRGLQGRPRHPHRRGPDPAVRADRRDREGHDHHDLRHRLAHLARRVPGGPGAGGRPRARRRHPRAGRGGVGLRGGRPRRGGRHHPVRLLLLLPGRRLLPVRGLRGPVGDHRRLAPRQLDRRGAGRVLPRAVRPGEPGEDPGGALRRGGPLRHRHRHDRDLRGGDGQRPARRLGGGVRPGARSASAPRPAPACAARVS